MKEYKTNIYCVWAFIPGTNQPSVFRYNQELDEGTKLAANMTKNSGGSSKYYCTEQEYGEYGESLGPIKSGIEKALELI